MADDTTGLTVIEGGKDNDEQPIKPGKGNRHRKQDILKGDDKLTNKQRAFANAMLRGAGSQSAAYREAYDAEGMNDSAVAVEAWRLMNHPKVALKLEQGFAAQAANATHSGASLALTIEQELVKMVIGPEKEAKAADRLRALELLGKSQKVGYFSTNLTVTNVDHMSEEELEEKLQQRLKELFKSTG
jgi:hypothetical protein